MMARFLLFLGGVITDHFSRHPSALRLQRIARSALLQLIFFKNILDTPPPYSPNGFMCYCLENGLFWGQKLFCKISKFTHTQNNCVILGFNV